jgi:hypothetical protein
MRVYSIANWKTIFPEAQNYLSAFCNRQHSLIWLPSGAGARGSWEGSAADGTLLCLVVLHNGCFYVIHREELRGGGREEKKQWPGSSKQRLLCATACSNQPSKKRKRIRQLKCLRRSNVSLFFSRTEARAQPTCPPRRKTAAHLI